MTCSGRELSVLLPVNSELFCPLYICLKWENRHFQLPYYHPEMIRQLLPIDLVVKLNYPSLEFYFCSVSFCLLIEFLNVILQIYLVKHLVKIYKFLVFSLETYTWVNGL